MDGALLIARLILALVLGTAGISKLLRPAASRAAMIAFGVPRPLVPASSLAVPVVELVLAVALIPAATARAAAVCALAVLGVFTAGVVVNLARGRRPACGCFGALSEDPIGPWTLVRNVLLMGLAAFVAAGGAGASLGRWFGGLSTLEKAGLVLLLALAGVIGFQVLFARANPPEAGEGAGDDEERWEEDWAGLPVDEPAPPFRLRAAGGSDVSLASLLSHGRPVLLVFVSPGCGSCAALLPDLAVWERELAAEVTLAVVSGEGVGGDGLGGDGLGPSTVLEDVDHAVGDAYRIAGTPVAVAVGADGRIAAGAVSGPDEIHMFIEREQWKAGASDTTG